jgi:flavorubredoxin
MIILVSSSILVIFAIITAIIVFLVEFREIAGPLKVLNPEGKTGTALIVYQKGLRDFQPKVANGFAEGLVSSGWKVEITTVNSQTPTDISSYDLMVLGWPTYIFSPSLPIRRYLKRIGDLKNKDVVILCTAAGYPGKSCEKMKSLVQGTNGNVVKTLTLFSVRPHEDNLDPVEIATETGKQSPSF